MVAVTQLAANQINADRAGLTSAEVKVPTAQAASPTEVLSTLVGSEYGGLNHLFSGSDIPQAVDTAVEIPTDSVRGRLGGLVPARGSVHQAGPTTMPAVAVPATVASTEKAAGSTFAKFRSILGV